MTIHDYEWIDYLQKRWDAVGRLADRHVPDSMLNRKIDEFSACANMVKALTGRDIEVNVDDEVYFVPRG